VNLRTGLLFIFGRCSYDFTAPFLVRKSLSRHPCRKKLRLHPCFSVFRRPVPSPAQSWDPVPLHIVMNGAFRFPYPLQLFISDRNGCYPEPPACLPFFSVPSPIELIMRRYFSKLLSGFSRPRNQRFTAYLSPRLQALRPVRSGLVFSGRFFSRAWFLHPVFWFYVHQVLNVLQLSSFTRTPLPRILEHLPIGFSAARD